MMKHRKILLLATALVLSLAACDGGNDTQPTAPNTEASSSSEDAPATVPVEEKEETPVYHVGDTVSTDIFEVTLQQFRKNMQQQKSQM